MKLCLYDLTRRGKKRGANKHLESFYNQTQSYLFFAYLPFDNSLYTQYVQIAFGGVCNDDPFLLNTLVFLFLCGTTLVIQHLIWMNSREKYKYFIQTLRQRWSHPSFIVLTFFSTRLVDPVQQCQMKNRKS